MSINFNAYLATFAISIIPNILLILIPVSQRYAQRKKTILNLVAKALNKIDYHRLIKIFQKKKLWSFQGNNSVEEINSFIDNLNITDPKIINIQFQIKSFSFKTTAIFNSQYVT
jgi:hypothetical protein